MSSSPLTFSVQALNVSIDASLATISGLTDASFACDVVCDLDLDLEVAKSMFLLQSDAIDINDIVASDLKYKISYTSDAPDADGIPATVLSADWLTNTLAAGTDNGDHVYTVGDSGAANKAVGDDYLRYLAYKLFRTHLGVDLFDNEELVKTNLDKSARIALDAKLTSIHDVSNNAFLPADECADILNSGFNHPSYSVIQSMIENDPVRFTDMSNNYVAGDQTGADPAGAEGAPYFKAPFVVGDVIQFKLTINADADQKTVVDDAALVISERTYRIRMNIV